ncbi:MAG: NAD-glutamate dehydrogenase, partial [Rhodospirillaceae bacterium]|nr:NAD-glutamate dehydrogenase [Rhodospirillaceae bacterium]
IESRLREAGRTWSDRLQEALLEHSGEEAGNRLYRRYSDGFPAGYQERFTAAMALLDIEKIEGALAQGELGMNLYRPLEAEENELRFKVYQYGQRAQPLGYPARAGEYGPQGAERGSLRDQAARQRGQGLDPRLRHGDERRPGGRFRGHSRSFPGKLPPHLARRHGK